MKFLIVGNTTSTQVARLSEEASMLGHLLDNCSSAGLIITAQKNEFKLSVEGLDLTTYDLIYLLAVGKRKWEWYVACTYLHDKFKTVVVENKMIDPNYKVFFSPVSELMKYSKEGIPFPKTAVVLSTVKIRKALEGFSYPVVVKNSYGQRGEGVSKAVSINEVEEIFEKDTKSHSFQLREFVPNNGDIRVFTVGYKAIGAIKRTPKVGEFRSNISRGGRGEIFDLEVNPKIKELAEKVSLLTKSEIAGVDIIIDNRTAKPFVLEVNRGPQFAGLEKYGKVNVAKSMINYFVEKAGQI